MQKIKKVVSYAVGLPAAVIMFSSNEQATNLGIILQLVAAGLVLSILAWNGLFKKVKE